MQFFDLAQTISKDYPTLQSFDKITEMIKILQPMLTNYIESFDFITKVRIPVIKLFGKEESMPEIFERINKSGRSVNTTSSLISPSRRVNTTSRTARTSQSGCHVNMTSLASVSAYVLCKHNICPGNRNGKWLYC